MHAVERAVPVALALMLAACGGASSGARPERTLASYVQAVRRGDAKAAYALLDADTREQVDLAEFGRLLRDNRKELLEQAARIAKASRTAVQAEARVPLESGETAVLLLEGGVWRVEGGVLDAPTMRTPKDAVVSLRRALARHASLGLTRVLARTTRAELDAEIKRFIEETEDELDLQYEVEGNSARVRTTEGREIRLIREAGEWRVLEIRDP